MTEQFVVIPNYGGKYLVSSNGHIVSKKQTFKRILSPWICGSGYKQVSLFKNGKHKKICVHTLVARAFISNDDPTKEWVNHKDGNKLNNAIKNLEWVTPSENSVHYHNELKEKSF